MKVLTKLNEIHKIYKYNKYINNNLIPLVNKNLNLNLQLVGLYGDEFTCKFKTIRNEDNDFVDISIKFTTNHIDIEGICWATLIIAGRTYEIGSITGELSYDYDIIEDSYYDFYEQAEEKGIKLPMHSMGE